MSEPHAPVGILRGRHCWICGKLVSNDEAGLDLVPPPDPQPAAAVRFAFGPRGLRV